jgi:hypothetical protein
MNVMTMTPATYLWIGGLVTALCMWIVGRKRRGDL